MTKETRMYYDCNELDKAIYMYNNFGVELEFLDVRNNKFTPFVNWELPFYDIAEFIEDMKLMPKVYIAKESEHIFEPRDRDAVVARYAQKDSVAILSDIHKYMDDNGKAVFYREYMEREIVLRDNKQFFMPKTEELWKK